MACPLVLLLCDCIETGTLLGVADGRNIRSVADIYESLLPAVLVDHFRIIDPTFRAGGRLETPYREAMVCIEADAMPFLKRNCHGTWSNAAPN